MIFVVSGMTQTTGEFCVRFCVEYLRSEKQKTLQFNKMASNSPNHLDENFFDPLAIKLMWPVDENNYSLKVDEKGSHLSLFRFCVQLQKCHKGT